MANEYATLADVRTHLRLATTDTSLDGAINSLLEPVSRVIDRWCRTHFYGVTATRAYDFQDPWRLQLRRQLMSVTSFTNGDGSTLAATTDYLLYPDTGPPYYHIEINRNGGLPMVYVGTHQRAIRIAGVWGDTRATSTLLVKQATCEWIGYLLTAAESAGTSTRAIGTVSTSYTGLLQGLQQPPGEVMAMLSSLRYRTIG